MTKPEDLEKIRKEYEALCRRIRQAELKDDELKEVSGGDALVIPTPTLHPDLPIIRPDVKLQINCPIKGCGACLSSIEKLKHHMRMEHGIDSDLYGGLIHTDLPNP